MAKFLVTGYPGTGKSSVANELKKLGRNAYDTESMHAYMHAESLDNGRREPLPRPVPRGWFTTNAYNWDIIRVQQLLDAHDELYICALADNQELLYPSFDKIFLLMLDETVLQQRLAMRTTANYGKDRDELSDILLAHRHFEQSLLAQGAIPINVTASLRDVANRRFNHGTYYYWQISYY
jgi:gluconate kinase